MQPAQLPKVGLDPLERRLDPGQHVLGVLLERVVDLAVQGRGGGVGEVVVVRLLLGFVLQRPRVRLVQALDGQRDPVTLVEQDLRKRSVSTHRVYPPVDSAEGLIRVGAGGLA